MLNHPQTCHEFYQRIRVTKFALLLVSTPYLQVHQLQDNIAQHFLWLVLVPSESCAWCTQAPARKSKAENLMFNKTTLVVLEVTSHYYSVVPHTTIPNVTFLVIEIQHTLLKCLLLPLPDFKKLIIKLKPAVIPAYQKSLLLGSASGSIRW